MGKYYLMENISNETPINQYWYYIGNVSYGTSILTNIRFIGFTLGKYCANIGKMSTSQ